MTNLEDTFPPEPETCRVPVFDCGGPLRGVQLEDNSALLDYLDTVDGPSGANTLTLTVVVAPRPQDTAGETEPPLG